MERRKIVPRYGMIIDLSHCNGCYNCQIACKDEHVENNFLPYSKAQPLSGQFWMRIEEKERGQFPRVLMTYFPIPCQHCQTQTPCMNADTTKAIKRRSDGIILIDPEKARGKKELVTSCPFGTIFWNEENQIPQKCTFCAHLLDAGWKEPRCVEACPTQAILFGDLDDPQSEISRKRKEFETEALWGRNDLKPRVLYTALPKPFLSGTVALGDTDECAIGAKVTLHDKSKGPLKETVTDSFGDFQFDGPTLSHFYRLHVEMKGYIPYEVDIDFKGDTTLKEIILKKTD
jgi:Fe-S-cluster-containing dehydrogenase component